MRSRLWLGACVGALALAASGAAAPARASSGGMIDDGSPGLLTVDADILPWEVALDPGMSATWLLSPHLEAPTDSLLSVDIESSGALAQTPGGLTIAIDECDIPWSSGAGCSGSTTARLAPTAFTAIASGAWMPFGSLAAGQSRHFRVTIALPDPAPAELQGASAEFSVGFAAAGDQEIVRSPGGPPELGQSGVALAVPLALAAVLGGVGAIARLVARRRRP